MGDVVAKIKVMPKDPAKLEELKGKLDFAEDIQEEPVAFGLSALIILVRVPDKEGGLDAVEKKLADEPLASSYEILEIGRI